MYYAPIERIKTPHLILRKLEQGDVRTYYERIGSSKDVTRGMLWDPHKDVSQSQASIDKALRRYAGGKCYRWAIALPEDNSVIGVVELLSFDEEKDTCGFAYMLGKDYWGKGYGTEALHAAMDFAFSRMGIWMIHGDHFADNPASGAVMRKVGMKYMGTVPGKYEKNGRVIDAECYRVTKEEFFR